MTIEYPKVAPSAEKIAQVMALVVELKNKEIEFTKAEETAKTHKLALDELARKKIPELMLEMGLRELPLAGGEMLVIDDKISASIPKDRLDEAIKWLDAQGEGGMVKRVVSVAFNRDQETAAKALVKDLSAKFAGTTVDAWIESQTLKAFATKRVKAGDEKFPKDLFGVFRFDQATVKEPKKKRSKGEGGKDAVFDS